MLDSCEVLEVTAENMSSSGSGRCWLIFRALQGTTEGCRLTTLKTINQGIHTIAKAVQDLEKKKKIMLLKEIFFKITNSSEDNARVLYPIHFDRIQEFGRSLADDQRVELATINTAEGERAQNEGASKDQGSKSRLVKVLYQGAGDYSQTRAFPQREPCLREALPKTKQILSSIKSSIMRKVLLTNKLRLILSSSYQTRKICRIYLLISQLQRPHQCQYRQILLKFKICQARYWKFSG
ncbi:unnamed protein product [Mytilus edulis]|uniref:Uncharacterized protein n=1 Tax=Mytilus edulis TaxID=6550 RepID=A0A8S3UCK4_MYTED|nr:unnamed protein product [Mytilus edulis]